MPIPLDVIEADTRLIEAASRRSLAPWAADPTYAAMQAAVTIAPDLGGLAAFLLPWCPTWVRTAAGTDQPVTAPVRLDLALDRAVALALDHRRFGNVMLIRIPRRDAMARAAAVAARYELPKGTVIEDVGAGRAWVLWLLERTVDLDGGATSAKQRHLFDYAGRLMAAAHGGTLAGHMEAMPNPWAGDRAGLFFRTTPGDLVRVRLNDVVARLADDFKRLPGARNPAWSARRKEGEPAYRSTHIDSRNCIVFHEAMQWASRQNVRDLDAIRAHAASLNVAGLVPSKPAMDATEIEGIARSITSRMGGYVGKRRKGPCNRARDAIDGIGLSRRDRQSLAGERTSELRREETDRAIGRGVMALREAGEKTTQAAVASASGVSIGSVRRRWHELERCVALWKTTSAQAVSYSGCASRASPVPSDQSSSSLAGGAAAGRRAEPRTPSRPLRQTHSFDVTGPLPGFERSITVLHAPGRFLTKQFVPAQDRRLPIGCRSFDNSAKTFDAETVTFDGIRDVLPFLCKLEYMPSSCVIMGQSVEERRKRVRRSGAVFHEAKRHLRCLDLDGITLPAGMSVLDDPEGAARWLMKHLGEIEPAFAGVTGIVRFSASAGLGEIVDRQETEGGFRSRWRNVAKPGLSAHVWLWLKTPLSRKALAQWRNWIVTKGLPVDAATFNPTQPIYTAAPRFLAGLVDPLVGRRLWLIEGERDVADLS